MTQRCKNNSETKSKVRFVSAKVSPTFLRTQSAVRANSQKVSIISVCIMSAELSAPLFWKTSYMPLNKLQILVFHTINISALYTLCRDRLP